MSGTNNTGRTLPMNRREHPIRAVPHSARELGVASIALAASILALLQACGGGGGGSDSQPPPSTPPTTPSPPTTPPPTTPTGVSGIDSRPSNATCVAWARPATGSISLTRFTDLSFSASIAMLQAPADNSRWFVVEQGGVVKQFNTATPNVATSFIDIQGRVS